MEETGLAHYDGGVFGAGIANTIFPLGGDVYLEVEAVTDPVAVRDAGPPGSTGPSRTATGGCSGACAPTPSMSWPRSRSGLAAKWRGFRARPARRHPAHHHHRTRPRPRARHVLAPGLPNWFYREDPATNPDRGATESGDRGAAVTRLEIGADAGELREHIGAETFERLPLVVVPGRPGVRAVTVRTASGREVTLRRDPADL
ncbi:hypothetical protein NKH77_52475 [Streptomyces sp. M19]